MLPGLHKSGRVFPLELLYTLIQLIWLTAHFLSLRPVYRSRVWGPEEVRVECLEFVVRWYSPVAWVGLVVALLVYLFTEGLRQYVKDFPTWFKQTGRYGKSYGWEWKGRSNWLMRKWICFAYERGV